MTGFTSLAEFAPEGAEAGVGLALQDVSDRYIFFLAGRRHQCPPGELFYAGIGGHREAGESWLDCAQREAREEIGSKVDITSARSTWLIPNRKPVRRLQLTDWPRPLALYEMIHPSGTPNEGELYRLVIFQARLLDTPVQGPVNELRGVIALSAEQVIRGPQRRPTLAGLLAEGAAILSSAESLDRQVRLYPLGTAVALAHVLALQS